MSPVQEQLAALRAAGAAQHEPVHWHYLETLARRAQAQPAQVQQLLHARLQALLTALQQRLAQRTGPSPADATAAAPAVAPARPSALGELSRYLQQQTGAHEAGPAPLPGLAPQATAGAHRELKSVRQARSTWSRLSADKQLNQALDMAPKNAGPINSHMVVLRSLRLMRDISPDYLNRFVSYVDTLLCLEQAENERPASAKATADGSAPRKPRVRKAAGLQGT